MILDSNAPSLRTVRTGRPRQNEIQQRQEVILEAAGETFLRLGFDGATMDAVADAARVSKRTLYARYPDKATLFNAVLRGLINRWLVPIDQVRSKRGKLEERLHSLAHYLATFALTPQSISINRIIVSEVERWPEFGELANEAGRKPAIRAIVSILQQHQAELTAIDLEMAAEQFMSLAIDSCIRRASLGMAPTSTDIEKWVTAAVQLFLNGIRK